MHRLVSGQLVIVDRRRAKRCQSTSVGQLLSSIEDRTAGLGCVRHEIFEWRASRQAVCHSVLQSVAILQPLTALNMLKLRCLYANLALAIQEHNRFTMVAGRSNQLNKNFSAITSETRHRILYSVVFLAYVAIKPVVVVQTENVVETESFVHI